MSTNQQAYPGLWTISLNTLTASSLLIFSKFTSLTWNKTRNKIKFSIWIVKQKKTKKSIKCMACSPSRHTYETVLILSSQCHLLILWKQDIKIYTKFTKLIKAGLWERQQTFKDYCRNCHQTKLTYKDLTYCTNANFKTSSSHWIILSNIYLEKHIAWFYSSIQINSTPLKTKTKTLIPWHWVKTLVFKSHTILQT